jgi:hypothetical protein
MRLFFGLMFIFVAGMPSVAWSQDAQVAASVSSDTIGLQDQLRFTISVSGSSSGEAENPRISNLNGFTIASGPSVGTQFQWINGRSNNSKSFTYILIPEKEGQFIIAPVEVRVGGRVYKTQPVQIRVTAASRKPSPQPQRQPGFLNPAEEEDNQSRRLDADAVMVKAELDHRSAYPGQQVTLAYTLYTRVRITGIQLQESPSLAGFWVEDLDLEKSQKEEPRVVNGREYRTITIRKQALFATTTGKLKIPSSTFAISASTGGDIFGMFGGDQTLYRKAPETLLEVKPLPAAGRPPDFSNAVGAFTLAASLDKTQAVSGDAVALRVKLEGHGNLKTIPDIAVPPTSDFTVFSSKRADTNRLYPESQLGGEKTWEYVLVPRTPGLQTIPPLSFSFFNIDRDKYETVTTPALSLNVTHGADGSAALSGLSDSAKQDLIRRGSDISFIKQSPGSLEYSGRSLYNYLWFYLAAVISLAFNAGAFFCQRRRSRVAGNGVIRSRRARRVALKRLRNAEKEGRSDARRYYDRAAAALSKYLSEKLAMTEIELTGDNLERALSGKAAPPEIVAETRACLQECDFGRFVSASGSADKMAALSARIRKNIEALEKIEAKKDSNGATG